MAFNPQELKEAVYKGALPDTWGMSYNGTSPKVAEAVTGAFTATNAAFQHYAAVFKDERLSRSERAKAYAKGRDFVNSKVDAKVKSARAALESEEREYRTQREYALTAGMTDEMALSLAVQLRQVGGEGAFGVAGSDFRFIQAVARVPAAVSGFTQEQVDSLLGVGFERHKPDIAALGKSVEMGRMSVDRAEKTFLDTAFLIGNSIDEDDLKAATALENYLKL